MTAIYSRIRSTGASLSSYPAAEQSVATTDQHPTVGTAERAARQALADADLAPTDVDFLVIGTCSPDVVFPNVACILQERLGIRGCAAFSVEAGATGFIYALSISDRFIATGQNSRALVIGAESLTKNSGPGTPDEFVAAAGAVVLEPGSSPGIVSCYLGADRNFAELPAEDVKTAVASLRPSVEEALGRQQLKVADIDWVIAHQSDPGVILEAAESLGVANGKFILPREDRRDIGAASIPLTFDAAIRDGRVSPGDLLLLVALGGSVTWGSALIRL